MKPPYTITSHILNLVSDIAEKIGIINTAYLSRPATELRKKNLIKTIQSSLAIEGNTLTEEQVTALLNDKRVLAPKKDILEVQNAISVYEQLNTFNPLSIKDLERAHKLLMQSLINDAGKLRTKNVGIIKGSQVQHVAPGGTMVKGLVKDLFTYIKKDKDPLLIKSCVFHYEFEFIHPFTDGNGRMGRLWQTLLLMQQYPVFTFLPIEHLIKITQQDYYHALSVCDKQGESTVFIEYILGIISVALDELLQTQNRTLTASDRIALFREKIGTSIFSRKEYLHAFKHISAPTASRDLAWATEQGIVRKEGDKRVAVYRYKK